MWPVFGAGLFSSQDAVLDSKLSADLLTLDDLPQ